MKIVEKVGWFTISGILFSRVQGLLLVMAYLETGEIIIISVNGSDF